MAGRLWQSRMQREVKQLQGAPPAGVAAWPVDGALNHLCAQLQGPQNTVYAGGVFRLDVRIPERYPMEPPKVRFVTPVYHPNIDSGGRICLDILNMPPKGGWTPRLEVPTVLASIRVLLAEPNPDDGLMADITDQYKNHRAAFDATARRMTAQHASTDTVVTATAHSVSTLTAPAAPQPFPGETERAATAATKDKGERAAAECGSERPATAAAGPSSSATDAVVGRKRAIALAAPEPASLAAMSATPTLAAAATAANPAAADKPQPRSRLQKRIKPS